MKKVLFILMFFTSQYSYSSNWIQSGSSLGEVYFYDKESIRKSKNIISYWGKVDYKSTQVQNDVYYDSSLTDLKLDCEKRLIQVISFIPQLNGQRIKIINFNSDWSSVIPDTPSDTQFKILCK